MSYLVIQVGHCGNRLGQNFFSTLSDITSKKKTAKNYEFLDKSDSRYLYSIVICIVFTNYVLFSSTVL